MNALTEPDIGYICYPELVDGGYGHVRDEVGIGLGTRECCFDPSSLSQAQEIILSHGSSEETS